MRFIELLRPRIAIKTVSLILLLAGMSALANWFCLHLVGQLGLVDRTIAQKVSPALLALTEAKTAVSRMGLAGYKLMAVTDREATREAGAEIRNQYEIARNSINAFVGHFADRADDVERLRSKLDVAFARADHVRAAVLADRDAEARRSVDLLFEPALDDLTFHLNRLINILNGDVKATLAEVAERVNFVFWAALLILAGGTLLTTGFAAAVAHGVIARPLERLAAHAARLRTEGLVNIPAGDRSLHRPDEIGMLARSFDLTISELDATRRKLSANLQRLDAAIDNLPQGLCMFDAEQTLIVCNRRYAEVYGLDPVELRAGITLREVLDLRVAAGAIPDGGAYVESELTAVAEHSPIYRTQELRDGRAIAVSLQPMLDGGWVALHEDVSDRRAAERQIDYLAHHDALTGLPNRSSFRREIEKALHRVKRGEQIAVLCLDLDRFKTVNDTLGHPIGDALLQAVAERIRDCTRETDMVARFGGDEFVILQSTGQQPAGATALAERMIEMISGPFDLAGHRIVVTASVGIAVSPGDGDDPDVLIKNADMALYRAKDDGRGIYRYFEPEMDARMQARRAMELDLRKALKTGELDLFYQPLVNLASGEITSFEALLRWHHPEHGLVAPSDFVPLAEEIGLIVPIGAWVLRRACADAVRWPASVRVAVNLSARQFAGSALALDVITALTASGLPPTRLELEITETVLLQDSEPTLAILNQLRDLGVHISMDDFGTGYSSLGYLKKFPFDKIKIDRSFVHDLTDRSESTTIVRAIAGIGNALGITTTAEGVETDEQLRRLREEGCTEIQGYLISEPRPLADIERLLAARGHERAEATATEVA